MTAVTMLRVLLKRNHKNKHKLTHYIRTHKAAIQQDSAGRKLINQYEILSEIGRGVHGKVKLARDKDRGEDDGFRVAIKIIQRFSRNKRRLGRVTVSPEDKTKREIAILKKIRHPNVVGLYEVIDDPDYNKIYMVLEFVERGEIKWRRKGDTRICAFERRRIERELRGEDDNGDDERLFKVLQRRRVRKDAQRARLAQQPLDSAGFWSLEHGDDEDENFGDLTPLSRVSTQESIFQPSSFQSHRSHMSHTSLVRSNPASRSASRNTSRAPSRTASARRQSTRTIEYDMGPIDSDNDETPGPLPSLPSTHSSFPGLHANLNAHANRNKDTLARGRSPSVADSIISNMSSIDDIVQHDSFEDDFSYVPCFTLDQARSTFRDTVLGLEYLHYEGIVHRDIKPANLLWTRDFRVKISDFGVSYFGRPIRDGDPGDVSESEAHDFDDDLELSKTVGTPAFFAPELCYTDLETPPPKITEQIDVWSLGVTLYCLIFARIPFLAEDEYQLFRAIAQQDVHIPRRRLKPVVSDTVDDRIPEFAYRDERELVMETVDDELYNLLRRMLTKDPAERIKLREVKRHPWVVRGIDNVIGWLDDTDPSRRTAGKRIQVDDRELERAVIPISLIDRARSAVKKAVGKVLGRSQDGSRRRAPSTATSSGDGGFGSPQTPAYDRDNRRMSLRTDDSYFSQLTDHPLSQSVTCSPQQEPLHGNDLDVQTMPLSIPSQQQVSHQHTNSNPDNQRKGFLSRPAAPNRAVSTAATIKGYMPRSPLPSPGGERHQSTMFAPDVMTTFTDHFGSALRDTIKLKNIRSMDLMKDDKADQINRARSADRAPDGKHAASTTGLTKAVAEAKHLFGHHHSKSTNDTREPTDHGHIQQPLPHRPALSSNHKPSLSSPIIGTLNYAAMKLDNRPSTATRAPEVRTPPRLWEPTTPDSLQREQERLEAHRRLQNIGVSRPTSRQQTPVEHHRTQSPNKSHPPSPWASPRDAAFSHRRYDVAGQGTSSSSVNSYTNMSPADTSASNIASPISSSTLSSDQMGSSQDQFPSHISLPALVSGASSVSADQESDTITNSSVNTLLPEHRGSPGTPTPQHLTKYNSNDEPVVLEGNPSEEEMRREMYNARNIVSSYEPPNHFAREEDSESDSDEGLTMGRRKKPESKTPSKTPSKTSSPGLEPKERDSPQRQPWAERRLERRNTNCSVGSTGTAKKIEMSD